MVIYAGFFCLQLGWIVIVMFIILIVSSKEPFLLLVKFVGL